MTDETERSATPLCQSIELALTNQPDVKNKYGSGRIRPQRVVFYYLDGRINAHLYGVWIREDGELTDAPVDQDYRHDADWPDWLASLARDHQPAVAPATDRAYVLREAADICDEAGAVYGSRGNNDAAGAAFALMETFLRKANEAEYVATPCSVGGCEPGGEPCSTHERLMAHAEGDHELCAPDCGVAPAVRPFRDEPTEVLRAAHGLASTHAKQAARFSPDQQDDPLPAVVDLFRDELQHRGEL